MGRRGELKQDDRIKKIQRIPESGRVGEIRRTTFFDFPLFFFSESSESPKSCHPVSADPFQAGNGDFLAEIEHGNAV